MPQVNGNQYRSFGQGYRAEKEKSGAAEPKDHADGESEGKGSKLAKVKHKGGGKFALQLQHEDGSKEPASAETPEEMHQKLDEHFGVGGDPTESDDDDYGGGENPLDSMMHKH